MRARLRDARFPVVRTPDAFDLAASDGAVGATPICELARGEWIGRAHIVIVAGPIGTGKKHLAIAVEAARQRRRVLFTRADVVRS